ncbi:MAG: peptidoglycan-binding protein, partial [Lachnospiraceae bacterium]|nr:peptidoglycan-binding protein [Lachnospiraceae bacterium]
MVIERTMFTMLKNKYVILTCSLVLVLNSLQAFAAEVDTSDPKTITSVQVVLSSMGYDCGGSTGVLDDVTGDAIRRYQNDHGLDADGVITNALLESLSSNESSLKIPGMSLENFINRYNSAVVNTSGNGVSSMNLLADISDSSLGYDLDNQSSVKMWINEGFGNSQDIVGKTRIKTQNSGSMSNVAKEEIVNCIYAIDDSLTTRAEAEEIYNRIIQSNGSVSEDGILYELEMNEEMISISAEYEGFVDTYSS